ncbi:hypothetical protein PF003_g28052 [Phytophthora fragariae]|nr:hypothetical protein PF003_g28052 [Phytophthora fragariae]
MLMTPTSLSPTLVVRQGPCRARGTGGDTPKVLIAGQDVVRQHDEVTCVDVVTVSGEQDEHEHAPDHQQRVKRRGQFGNAAPREVLAGRDDAGLADGKVAEGQQQQRVEAPDVHDLPVLRRRVSDPLDSLGNVATSSVAWEVSSELRVEWIKCSNGASPLPSLLLLLVAEDSVFNSSDATETGTDALMTSATTDLTADEEVGQETLLLRLPTVLRACGWLSMPLTAPLSIAVSPLSYEVRLGRQLQRALQAPRNGSATHTPATKTSAGRAPTMRRGRQLQRALQAPHNGSATHTLAAKPSAGSLISNEAVILIEKYACDLRWYESPFSSS